MSQKAGANCPHCSSFVQFNITESTNHSSATQCPKCHKTVHYKTDSKGQLKELKK